MRPLFHPSIDGHHGRGDPPRFVRSGAGGYLCQHRGAGVLAKLFGISDGQREDDPKSTLSQHFRELREAGLIRGERRGVEVHNSSRCKELEQRFPWLVRAIVNAHAIQLKDEARAKKVAANRHAKRVPKNKS